MFLVKEVVNVIIQALICLKDESHWAKIKIFTGKHSILPGSFVHLNSLTGALFQVPQEIEFKVSCDVSNTQQLIVVESLFNQINLPCATANSCIEFDLEFSTNEQLTEHKLKCVVSFVTIKTHLHDTLSSSFEPCSSTEADSQQDIQSATPLISKKETKADVKVRQRSTTTRLISVSTMSLRLLNPLRFSYSTKRTGLHCGSIECTVTNALLEDSVNDTVRITSNPINLVDNLQLLQHPTATTVLLPGQNFKYLMKFNQSSTQNLFNNNNECLVKVSVGFSYLKDGKFWFMR